ncbi:MAG: ComEC family competence protein [Bacteroidales bacterium]|nr:ComEC family competence protein [Bacteroidales bacterium]
MFWQDRPFVRILFFFLTGIFLAYYLPIFQNLPLIFCTVTSTAFLLLSLLFTLFLKSYRYRWLSGFTIYGTLVFAGMGLTNLHLKQSNAIPSDSGFLSGEVLTEPQTTNKSVKLILSVSEEGASQSQSAPFKVMAYFEKDSASKTLHLGDFVAFEGRFQEPAKALNPGEFDFRNYLRNQGINYMLFVKKHQWKKLTYKSPFNLKAPFASWRNFLLTTLRKNGLKGDEFQVAAAILLGYDQLLEPEVHQNYVAAGVVHILCVSGMHVGIIFLVLNFLLGFLNRFSHGKRIKNILLLLFIWCYALLTGLAPSVLRASVMVSFFIVANALEREYDNYNLLAASAFLLLIFNPLLIFNVGFQLSYAAVLGILLFYFPIYSRVYFKYKFPDVLWAALVVSFSAELGVFPIAIHYFHLFPVYFLITNLLVFALSYLILSSGMALLVFSWIPEVSKVLGFILNVFIESLNRIVDFVAHLPQSQIQDLFLPWSRVWIIYLLIVLTYLLFVNKKIRLLLPVLAVSLLFMSLHTFRTYQSLKQEKLVVYALPYHTAIDFIQGNKHELLADSSALKSGETLNYHTEEFRIENRLEKQFAVLEQTKISPVVFYDGGFAKFGKTRLFILNPKENQFPELDKKIEVDYLIYRGSRKIPLEDIMKSVSFKKVVFDGSVSPYREKVLIKDSKNLHLKPVSLLESGALIVDGR